MDDFNWIILAVVIVPLIWAVATAMTTAGFQKKFADLGELRGLTKGEIFHAVGPPNSTSAVGDGQELLQWQTTGYHIALLFKEGICEGVSHEHRAF